MAELSPQAQAVMDAYFTEADRLDREVSDNEMIAAALRAAANAVQIKPYTFAHAEFWSALLDIALELEKGNE